HEIAHRIASDPSLSNITVLGLDPGSMGTGLGAADAVRACFEIDPPKGRAMHLNGTDETETAKAAQDPVKRK
ncbi:hypothetical protein QQS21_006405, partial [Conoideocrella luteorostrata]